MNIHFKGLFKLRHIYNSRISNYQKYTSSAEYHLISTDVIFKNQLSSLSLIENSIHTEQWLTGSDGLVPILIPRRKVSPPHLQKDFAKRIECCVQFLWPTHWATTENKGEHT